MKRLTMVLMTISSAVMLLSSCSAANKGRKPIYKSRIEAEIACKEWKRKGGTWNMQVQDMIISGKDQIKSKNFPIIIKNEGGQSSEDQTSSELKSSEDLKAFLPLFSTNKEKQKKAEDIVIRSTGETKEVSYYRRICRLEPKYKKSIIGEEYQIDLGAEAKTGNIPLLRYIGRYDFKE